ncbi:probable LRR receptor-like serine/threonine-protein kinase At1g51810 [Pistacia vera]|uniref:probable LRR receptor-like serine/threonine-protein kinase At1g51810 n=1 Tax=Pistacia vera TaxID=55513 RepID=UPI0012638E8A|nr:probable LRR receptor-like serine/threonine-protein kinase At1g51810 [Pistacia vera]
MLDRQVLFLALKLWLVSVSVVCNSKLGEAYDEQAARKLSDDVSAGFISIDCRASGDYKDDETGLVYESDMKYIDTGEIHQLSSNLAEGLYKQQMKNLRSFPQGTRNCYTLNPKQGANNNYLIRASFMYGNYDNKNQFPIFDLYLGVNRWVTHNASTASSYYYEIIHVPTVDYIDVCLVNTGNGIPFISVLELRTLADTNTYQMGKNEAKRTVRRYDVGGQHNQQGTGSIRYPGDSYDRIWFDLNFDDWNPISTDSTIYSPNIDDGNYKVPDEVLKTAATSQDAMSPLIEGSDSNYFPPIPPMLNAFEAFVSLELPLSPTYPNDVNAIRDIKTTYKVIRNWQGDPCLPSSFSWNGLSCNNDTNPRIISLNLSSSNLSEIAHSFSNLEAIEVLDLSYNNLNGSIPEFLARLPNLKVLNLTGNRFTSVPGALLEKVKDKTLLLSLEGLEGDTDKPAPTHGKRKMLIIAVSIVVTIVVVLSMYFAFCRGKRKVNRYQKNVSMKSQDEAYTYSEILTITNNLTTVIGEGGFGKVYLGNVGCNTKVAVKVLSGTSKQGYKEFRAEAEQLRTVHNKHLVHLIGYCDEDEHKALIYEFMKNGNLRHHLRGKPDANLLRWKDRINIAIDSAKGLEYLHNVCRPPIVHRDLKTTNILLDDKMQAKLADFGLSRVVPESGPNSTVPAGTLGYIDPKLRDSSILTRKMDIYSFGIILFELITGKPAIIKKDQESGVYHILHWVDPEIKSGDIKNIVDPRFEGEFNANAVRKMANIASLCAQPDVNGRPDISDILVGLRECLAIEMDPGTTCKTEGLAIEMNPGTTCMTDSFMSASSNLPEEPSSGHGLELAVIP